MSAITAAAVEYAIEHPSDGQVELFLDFEWLVPLVDGEWWSSDRGSLFPTHYLFTAPERMEPLLKANQHGKAFAEKPWPLTTPDGWQLVRPMNYQPVLERCQFAPVRGRELFAQLVATTDYHSVQINSSCGTWDEPHRNGALLIPCGGTRELAQGLDPRPGTRPLGARSIAEIHLYMRHFHGVVDPTHRLEYLGDTLVATYEGEGVNREMRRQSFLPVNPQPEPRDYGPGPSPILCGGLMAHHLGGRLWDIRNNFHPETRAALHGQMPDILRQCGEVEKMLDPQTDRIAPEFFRFDHAPGFLKQKPELIEGAWLREARPIFERFLADGPDFRP